MSWLAFFVSGLLFLGECLRAFLAICLMAMAIVAVMMLVALVLAFTLPMRGWRAMSRRVRPGVPS